MASNKEIREKRQKLENKFLHGKPMKKGGPFSRSVEERKLRLRKKFPIGPSTSPKPRKKKRR